MLARTILPNAAIKTPIDTIDSTVAAIAPRLSPCRRPARPTPNAVRSVTAIAARTGRRNPAAATK
jgi:hypothetical protein